MHSLTLPRLHDAPVHSLAVAILRGIPEMALHKRILEWQAAHPNITWIGWAIV